MTKQEPFPDQLARLLDSSQPLASLRFLSDITGEGLALLRRKWPAVDAGRRRQIIGQLVKLHRTDALMNLDEVFLMALDDTDEVVRSQAIQGLDDMEERRLSDRLLGLLENDPSNLVRSAAVSTLGKVAVLAELRKLDAARSSAIYAALQEVWQDRRESLDMRCLAIEAIGVFSAPETAEFIKEAYDSGGARVKASSVRAMGRNCDPAWVPLLVAEMKSSATELRYEAALASGEVASEEAVPQLTSLVDDHELHVQRAAIWALGEIGNSRARAVLRKLVSSRDEQIRQTAEAALAQASFWEDPLTSEL
ncbi:MAG: HEAT repeat domain-containing protein [Chloroflexota bacterium]